MKFIIILFYLPILLGFHPSETDNFEIQNSKVIWQKVYETDLNKEELIEMIKSSGNFKNVELSERGVFAEIYNLSLDYKGYGLTEMSTPIYISRSRVNSFLQIEFKENRYRVTIKNIKLTQNYNDGVSLQGEMTDLEVFALKKRNSEFKSSFLKKPAKIINYTFQNITEFKKAEQNKW